MRYLIILFAFFSQFSLGQDIQKWSYEINFQLNMHEDHFQFENFQLYVDDPKLEFNQNALLIDKGNHFYQLVLEYACETCSFSVDLPPNFYLKINYLKKKNKQELFTLIPIAFEGFRPRKLEPFDLGNLLIDDFLNEGRLVDNAYLYPYEAVVVQNYKDIKFLQKGEFTWKPLKNIREITLQK